MRTTHGALVRTYTLAPRAHYCRELYPRLVTAAATTATPQPSLTTSHPRAGRRVLSPQVL